jgi:hypothetical protein
VIFSVVPNQDRLGELIFVDQYGQAVAYNTLGDGLAKAINPSGALHLSGWYLID